MNSKINILHLSDLHFGAEAKGKITSTAISKKNNVINPLLNTIENLEQDWKPDIVVVSGDIGWSGKREDYQIAKNWIDELLDKIGLTPNELIVCVGNHDLDRDKATGLIKSPSCNEADECLDIEKIDNLIIPFSEYNKFCEDIGIIKLNIGEKEYFLMGQREIKGIKFIVLNSSWFSRDDNDAGRLYLGLPQLEVMESENQLIDPEKYDNEQISISVLHHPYDKFAEDEKNSYGNRIATYSYLSQHSHIILSGHTHNQSITKPDKKFNRAWLFIAGSAYSEAYYFNNFSILQIDKNDRTVNRISYEYDPRSRKWMEKIDDDIYDLNINKVEDEQTEIELSWKQYCSEIKKDFKTIKDISAIWTTAELPLEDMYVYLRITKPDQKLKDLSSINTDERSKGELTEINKENELIKQRTFDIDESIDSFGKLVLIGDPGSGKTTLLRHITLKFCTKNIEKGEIISVPIPITLKEYSEKEMDLRDYIDEILDKYQFSKAKDFIEQYLDNGKCTLLLDGFDELVTNNNKDLILKQIQKFVEKYPDNRIIVTSRTADYNDELKEFTKFKLIEFDNEQIKQFIYNWFKNNRNKAGSVLNAIMKNDRIKALARTPLILAIIAIIYEEDSKLPQERAELYNRCVEVLLNRWDLQRHVENTYMRYQKEFILRKLAFYAHDNNEKIIDDNEVKNEISKFLLQLNLKDDDTDPLLKEIWRRSNLLRKISIDSYDFLHLSFQEYFTALELKENVRLDEIDILIEHFNEPWWEEPTLLYAGIIKDAAALIERMDEEIEEDIFLSKLMFFGKLIVDAYATEYSYKEKVINDLWAVYRTSEFSSLKEKAISNLVLINSEDTIDSLLKDLKDKDNLVKESACRALGQLGEKKAVDPLMEILEKDKDNLVKESACRALGQLGEKKAVDSLVEVLEKDKNKDVRVSACTALGQLGDEKAVEPLLNSLKKDKKLSVQLYAALALGTIDNEKVIESLLELLKNDPDMYVRGCAASGLGISDNGKVIGPLLDAIKNEEEIIIHWMIAVSLGIKENEKLTEPLLEILENEEEDSAKWSATLALGFMGNTTTTELLVDGLNNEDDTVRMSATHALEYIMDERAIKPLLEVLKNDKEQLIRARAADALGFTGNENIIDEMIEILKVEAENDVLPHIIMALGNIGDERAIEPLQDYLNFMSESNDKKIKNAALEALEKISKKVKKKPFNLKD